MAILTDDTLQQIHSALQTKNKYLKDLVDMYANDSWDLVSANVKAGKAPTLYPIGTELICGYKVGDTTYQFPWIVADHRNVTWEDQTEHPAIILQAKFATVEAIQFDAAEITNVDSATEPTALAGWYYWGLTGSTYTALNLAEGATIPFSDYDSIKKCGINNLDVLRYGYNRYKESAQRQWLNSDADKGNWWESQHLGDVAPSQLNTYDGFLKGLDSDFLSVINPVKVQVATNTVTDGGVTDVMYDKFWLPSVEEMYGSPQLANVEGPYYPYWKEVTGLSAPSNAANNGRKCYAIESQSSAQVVRLRSAFRGDAYGAWHCGSAGEVNNYGSRYSYRAVPACAIS